MKEEHPVTQWTSALESLTRRGLKFGTIYADPPWRFRNRATRGAAEKHYPTMSLAEIAALPVPALTAEKWRRCRGNACVSAKALPCPE